MYPFVESYGVLAEQRAILPVRSSRASITVSGMISNLRTKFSSPRTLPRPVVAHHRLFEVQACDPRYPLGAGFSSAKPGDAPVGSASQLHRTNLVWGWSGPSAFSLMTSERWYSGSAAAYLPWSL